MFLARHKSPRTRANYAFILGGWVDWCAAHQVVVVDGVGPRVIETWIGHLQARRYAANNIAGRIAAVSAFYRWCVREQLIARNLVDAVRRPHRSGESSTASLTRHELTDWLAVAERQGGRGEPRRCRSA